MSEAGPAEAPAFDPKPRDPRLADWLQEYPSSLFSERLYQSVELMERYSIDLSIDLLGRLDVINELREWRSADELCRALSFQSRFRSAVTWLVERVIETGCVEARTTGDNRSYRLRHVPWLPDLARLREIGLEIAPGNSPTFALIDQGATVYPAV